MLQRRFSLTLLLLVTATALGDVGPGLYVSEDGEDSGPCTDVDNPCATIRYALGVAGKNTRVHVAEGSYVFDDPEAILYAMSGAVHVHGGYVADDQGQWIKGGVAFLTSVPPGYRDFFRNHGFIVIADAKGDETAPETAAAMLQQYQRAQVSSAAADCVDGTAAGFSCSAVDLLSHTSRSDFSSGPMAVADIWGFVDLNTRREYVIVGVQNGTAVFDVTDAQAPREVGFVGGQSATWRDIKVLQMLDEAEGRWHAYAYVTTDGASDELVVIDLGGLPHAIRRVTYAGDFLNAHNVYLTDTDYSTGVVLGDAEPQLIVAGAGIDNGQFRTYTLQDPAGPQFLQRVAAAGYMHDASSLRIADARRSQCPNGGATCNVLLDFNEENVEIWDITDAARPARMSTVAAYANTGYVHSGWWTEDRQYAFVHDELDERENGLTTTVRVVSLASLSDPAVVGQWSGTQPSTDHNGFVRGNRYYMSTYTRGLTVLDITSAAAPVEVGFFDTYPVSNSAVFAGAWGAYPYLPSGVIAVSDINSGLFLLNDSTRDVGAGSIGFDRASYAVTEGQAAAIPVSRTGGSTGTVSIAWEVVGLSGDTDDYQPAGGRLSWPDGDTADRTLVIDTVGDAANEDLEEVLVRLIDPLGGATLGATGTASLFIAEPGSSSALDLAGDEIDVPEQGFGLAVVTVKRTGSASGQASVSFAVTAGDATAAVDYDGPASGTLTWQDGDALPKSVQFEIAADTIAESPEFFDVSFTNPQGATLAGAATARVTIRDGSGGNSAPLASAGDDQTRVAGSNVMLNGSESFDPDGDTLAYSWTQETGPSVTLNGSNTEAATFIAPQVTSNTTLRFRLTVTDDRALSDSATTVVTVTAGQQGGSANGGGSGSGASGPLLVGLLAAAAVAARRRRSAASRGNGLSRKDCAW